MKRFISIVLAMLIMFVPVTAFAGTMENAMSNPAGTGEATIRDHIYSTYTIQIPETIEIDELNDTFNVGLTNDNIEDGYSVEVWITNLDENGAITLTNARDNSTETATISKDIGNGNEQTVNNSEALAYFHHDNVNSSQTQTARINITERGTTAGYYEGTITYCYACVNY